MAALTDVAGVVALALAASLGAGCGEALVSTDYIGEPLLSVNVGVPRYDDAPSQRLRLGVFWTTDGIVATDPATWVEGVSVAAPPPPSDVVLQLFEAPPVAARQETTSGNVWAAARIVLYQDADLDGDRDEADPIVAVVLNTGLLYAQTSLNEDESPTYRPLRSGISLARRPFPCAPPPTPNDETDCGVPLGEICERAVGSCEAEGICFGGTLGPLPAFVCAVEATSGCRPAAGAFIPAVNIDYEGIWLASCADDADCQSLRAPVCDVGANACVDHTTPQFASALGPEFQFRSLCSDLRLP